jgi:hypothetical protein
LLDRLTQGIDFLREGRDPDVVVVHFFANDPQVAREIVDNQLLIGESLSGRIGLLIKACVHGLQRFCQRRVQRADQVLQLLGLFLKHPNVSHELTLLLVGRLGGRQRKEDQPEPQQGANCGLPHNVLTLR